MLVERGCGCGNFYQAKVIEVCGATIPTPAKCPGCLAADAESARLAESSRRLAEAERSAEEIRGRDPEEMLRRFGFRDSELEGKDLRNFCCPTALHADRLTLAKKFAGSRTERPGLALLGSPGRGKTHLARGIARSLVLQGKEFRYWKLQDVIAECKRRFRSERETADDYIAWICSFPGLVIIDELGRSRGDQWDTDSVVYPLADRRMALPTIWISNFNLSALEAKYDEAVVSRLMRCQVVTFPDEMEDFRTR
jgi:DNA replication protein DnaC